MNSYYKIYNTSLVQNRSTRVGTHLSLDTVRPGREPVEYLLDRYPARASYQIIYEVCLLTFYM